MPTTIEETKTRQRKIIPGVAIHYNKTVIMKKMLVGLPMLLLVIGLSAQSQKYDSVAIIILDRMADVIGDLESCSFKVNIANDVAQPANGLIKYFSECEVYMSGPDKMLVNVRGHRGHRQLMYNGKQLAYFSFDENNYGIVPAPNTTLNMIDSINSYYDIEFPAADFFYPAFTDDLLQASDSLDFVGIERMGSKEYFHIISYSKTMDMQFWINNDAYNLPARFSITYKNKPGIPQYLAMFSDWQLNPTLPAAMFDFLPPPGAKWVRMMSKSDK